MLEGNSFPPTWFGGILLQSITWQINRPFTYTFSHITFLMSYVTFWNTHVDGLFVFYVVGWRKTLPNWIGIWDHPGESLPKSDPYTWWMERARAYDSTHALIMRRGDSKKDDKKRRLISSWYYYSLPIETIGKRMFSKLIGWEPPPSKGRVRYNSVGSTHWN